MNDKEKYDRAHKNRHEELKRGPLRDLLDVANPLHIARRIVMDEIERKAERDAEADEYHPPE